MHCFPSHGDEIRMRLYLADIGHSQGPIPALRYFWRTMKKTSIFSAISVSEDAAMRVLRREPYSVQPPVKNREDLRWDQEWQTVLLFLELYTFVLRLTDDDDFFNPASSVESVSRLRSSGLTMADLGNLTVFLKHLSFTLYYHASDIQHLVEGPTNAGSNMPESLPRPKLGQMARPEENKTQIFTITAGIDFHAFRDSVTATMRMLYERDSRRRFLPENHWLMTSKFDMEGFLSAVVLEEQRKQELRSAEDEDEDGDVDMDADDDDLDEYSHFSTSHQRLSRNAQIERLRHKQRLAARERLHAAVTPKLELLRHMPFVIPFETRVQIFRQFVYLDKMRRRGGNVEPDNWRAWIISQDPTQSLLNPLGANSRGDMLSRHHAEIHRGRVFNDALEHFYNLDEGLKEPIQITFVDEFGMPEAGIDGGGVTKEFLTSVTKETFSDDQRLFVTNSKNAFYPNPSIVDQHMASLRAVGVSENSESGKESHSDLLRQYEFLGRIIGKCMYEGILIDIAFAGFFLLKWAAGSDWTNRANLNDLHELDEELYQGMLRLKNYNGDTKDLELDFTITDQISRPNEPLRTITRNLITDGDKTAVTNENRLLYITYVARHRLVIQQFQQTRAFLRGLGLIIEPSWLSMFNQNELQRLVGGDSSEIDVEDMRRHTSYSGVYVIGDDGEEHPTIRMFWDAMHAMEDGERRDVLKFVTSTPRAPLLGFSQLRPPFTIRDGGSDEERLPSASTCVNLLKLPKYSSAKVLKEKLLYAVKSGAGFDLS
jgi:ubiquitin-protein ligase E3 C